MPARPPWIPGHEFSKRPCPIAAIISLTLFLLKHTQQKTHLRKTLHSEEGVFSKGKKYSQIKFPQFHKNLQLPGSQCMLWDRAEVIYSLGYFLMSSSNSTQQWVHWLLTAHNISLLQLDHLFNKHQHSKVGNYVLSNTFLCALSFSQVSVSGLWQWQYWGESWTDVWTLQNT